MINAIYSYKSTFIKLFILYCQSINHSIFQTVNQSTNQPTNQSINQSINLLIIRSLLLFHFLAFLLFISLLLPFLSTFPVFII